MQEAIEIKNEFYSEWVTQEGLGLLEPGKPNDNGILFLVFFQILLDIFGIYDEKDQAHFVNAHESIYVRPGEYKRRIEDFGTDAHDNMLAIVVGAKLAKKDYIVEEICDHMDKTGGVSDHTTNSKWKLSQMRQGSEIAFYRIMANRIPFFLDMFWLCGGLIVNAIKSNYSSKNLGFMRVWALTRFGYSHLPYLYHASLYLCVGIWWAIITFKKGVLHNFSNYYVERHPILKLMRMINGL